MRDEEDGTTQALVTELRALRADINRIVGASIRTQLLATRLQLQEQRILTVSRQLDDLQKETLQLSQQRGAIEFQLKQAREQPRTDDQPQELNQVVSMWSTQIGEIEKREQQLRMQESNLTAMLAEEQARWTDFSSRLDELERALVRPR